MEKSPTLNIVIPVFNEEAELATSVDTLVTFLKSQLPDFSWVVTIVDNASTDKTWEIAQKLTRKYNQTRALHLSQKGRGRAVKKAWTETETDVSAYMDVDLSTDLKHLPALVRSILRGYDLAIGSRNTRGSRVYGRNLMRWVTSIGYILLVKFFFWVHFSDAQCGFKAISRRAAEQLLSHVVDDEWFFDTELLILAERLGYRIYEEPVTWIDNPGSTVRVWKTAMGDLSGLWRLFVTRPWHKLRYGRH